MKSYKIVSVYSGYNEMDIIGVKVMKGGSVNEVCNSVNMKIKEVYSDSGGYWEEFCNHVLVDNNKDIGSVCSGEEGFEFVIGEGNEWYKKIDSRKEWSESEWNEWVELCNSDI